MKITGLLYDTCPNSPVCPRIIDTDGADVIAQGKKLANAEQLRAQFEVPDDEDLVGLPRDILDHMRLLDPDEFMAVFERIRPRSILRVENRREYLVDSDGGDFERFRAGLSLSSTEHSGWLQFMSQQTADGIEWRRIRLLEPELNDYCLYECHAYVDSVAHGEGVRVMQHADQDLIDVPDFHVLDDSHVLRIAYDDAGRHLGGVIVSGADAGAYRALANALWRAGEGFTAWWNEHPQYHRALRAA